VHRGAGGIGAGSMISSGRGNDGFSMARKQRASAYVFYALTAFVFIGGIVFWASDLKSDPPMYYSGLGQSLATDPHQYVFHARNEILYGQADPYDYPRWTVYEHSLTSLTAMIWFSLTEVSLTNANAVGVMLSLGGLLFFLLGLARHHRPWVLAAVAFVYVINITLITYGRLPYLENGLIFIASLVFFVYSWWGDRLRGAIAAGILVALAAFAGKLFGALLLPALIVSMLISDGDAKGKRTIASCAAFVVAGFAFILVFYGKNLTAAFSYASEQAYGIKGYPAGLTSPWSYLEYFITFGYRTRLFYRSPDLLMFIFSSCVMLITVFGIRERLQKLPRTSVFSFLWIGFVLIGLAPHDYSPMRYSLLSIPGIQLACFSLWDEMLGHRKIKIIVPGKIAATLIMAVSWFTFYPIVSNIFFFNEPQARWLVWVLLPAGIILGLATRLILKKWRPTLTRRAGIALLIAVLLLSAIANGFRYRRLNVLERNFNIVEAAEDLRHIVGRDAVISGPYAPALTVDNRVRSFIYLFGVAQVDSTLFDRYPITHIAVDQSNFDEALKAYPRIENAPVISRYWIRDYEVMLIKVNDLFGNNRANAYEESFYERAALYVHGNSLDSALHMMNLHLTRRPMTKSAGKLMAEIFLAQKQYERSVGMWRQLVEMYPTDFHIQMRAGEVILALGLANNNQGLVSEAYRLLAHGVSVNRYKADYANRIVANMLEQYRQSSQKSPSTVPGK